MLMLKVYTPPTSYLILTYAEIMAGVKERAKGYPKPELFRQMNLGKSVDAIIDVNESEHKRYVKAIQRLRNYKGY